MPRLGCTPFLSVPWGTHVCCYYQTPTELQQLLNAYFRTGLEDHEGCLWILPPWHTPTTATMALQWVIPHVYDHLATARLELVSSADWYGWPNLMNLARVVADGRAKIRRLSARFPGLRVAGDLSWVTSSGQRAPLLDYERVIDEIVQEANVLGLCTYPAADWTPSDRQDVLKHHQSVLLPDQVGWRLVDVRCA